MASGNVERDKILHRAIRETLALGETLAFGNVDEKLTAYPKFGLDDAELADALRDMKLLPQQATTPAAPEQPTPAVETAPEPEVKISRQAAEHLLQVAQARLDTVRDRIRTATQTVKDRQSVLAAEITRWQMEAGASLSMAQMAEREKRNFLLSEQQRRAQQRRPHGGADAFVRRHMRFNAPPGHGSHGAYSKEAAARVGYRVPGTGKWRPQ